MASVREQQGFSLQLEQQDFPAGKLSDLKIIIIEDSFESRGLIKSHLKSFGIQNIHTYENGSELLQQEAPIEADVVLLGFGLGYCHSGIELIQELDASGKLPVWSKVIFITNADVVASSSHPFRYLKCEVLRKPINPRLLLKLIMEGHSSIQLFKDVIANLTDNQLSGLLIKLEGIPRGELSATQQDELAAITMHLMLRLGKGNQAWTMSNSIQDEVFRTTNKLSIANALGDNRKLKITMGMLSGNDLMQKRSMIYEVYQTMSQHQFSDALATMKIVPLHKLSLAEIELYSLLLLEVNGLNKAVEFLEFKKRTTLENQFFRNSINLMLVKAYLYELLGDAQLVKESDDVVADMQLMLTETDWRRGAVDFSSLLPFIQCTFAFLKGEDPHSALSFLKNRVAAHDFFAQLLIASSAYQSDDMALSRDSLLRADQAMLSLEVSPETLLKRLWFDRVFNSIFSEPERAREYNRIGIHHAKEDNPYPALKMFYQSHLCARKNASIGINLLDALTKLGLSQYWDIDAHSLVSTINALPLRDNEQRKFQEVQNKMSA